MDYVENVNIRLSQVLADRIDAAAAAIGLSRAELMRRAIEAECTSTEELAAWREHEYGTSAVAVRHPDTEVAA
ncbi:MAG: ribbon-helix-helix protein, CopG family [Rhodospirillales bacterium]|nr:ribbon-helix-helix protein, CopG family [Rhodospirillales bacterium]